LSIRIKGDLIRLVAVTFLLTSLQAGYGPLWVIVAALCDGGVNRRPIQHGEFAITGIDEIFAILRHLAGAAALVDDVGGSAHFGSI